MGSVDGLDGVAQGLAGREVEADDGGGELSLVADGELGAGLFPVGQHAERDLGAVAGFDVETVEGVGIGLEVLPYFHDHVVLVELGEDGGDLALAEGVVEGVVDVGHGDAEAGGGVAVDDQAGAEALVLEVAGHVGYDIFLAEFADHQAGVFGQLDLVGIFQGVLKLGTADAVFDGEVLERLEEELNALHGQQLWLQALDDLRCGQFALVERLEGDLDAAGVEGGVGSVDADEGGDVIDGWVLKKNVHQLLLALGHAGEADGLRGLGDAQDHARILHREKALGNHDEEENGGHESGDGDHQRGEAVAQDHLQGAPIPGDDGIEDFLRPIVEAGLFGHRFVLEDARAHHGREGKGDERGDQDGDGQGDGELAEEPAHNVAHEEQRDKHRDERNGQGHDGEADLLAALEGGVHGAHPLLDEAGDVLDHDDGVVDDEAGGDGERHEGEVVEAVAQQVHHAEGADDGERDGDRGDDGGGEVAEEEEDDHDHQGDGEHELKFDVQHGGADGIGAVGKDPDLDSGGEAGLQLGQEFLDAVDDGDDVGAGLALDVDDDRGLAVHPGGLLGVFGGVDDGGYIGGADCGAVAIGDYHGLVIAAGNKLVVGADGVRLAGAVESSLGLVHVGRRQCGAQVFEAEVVGGKLGGVGLDAHGGLLAAGDGDQSDAGDLGDLLGEVGVGGVLDLVQGQRVGVERQRHDGRVGWVHLAVDGWIGQICWQKAVGGVDGGLDFLLGHIDVLVEVEFEGYDRAAAGADRGHLLESRHLAELALQRRGDRGGHHLRAATGVEGEHLDDGVVDLGQGRDGQLLVAHKSGQEDGRHQQRGGYRAQNEGPGRTQAHCFSLLSC